MRGINVALVLIVGAVLSIASWSLHRASERPDPDAGLRAHMAAYAKQHPEWPPAQVDAGRLAFRFLDGGEVRNIHIPTSGGHILLAADGGTYSVTIRDPSVVVYGADGGVMR